MGLKVRVLVSASALLMVGYSAEGSNTQNPPAQAVTPCNVTRGKVQWMVGDKVWSTSRMLDGFDGTIVFRPNGPGFVLKDGSLSMKVPWSWDRRVRGRVRVEGHRLDAAAPALRVDYGSPLVGFKATSLIFSTPGCWKVTGHLDTASLTFVTSVVKIGDGPGRPR